MELLKKRLSLKSEKIINKQQLYNAPLLKSAFPLLQNFFIYDFLKMAASEILLVFLNFLRHFVFETISVWVRSKSILIVIMFAYKITFRTHLKTYCFKNKM
jgi:hypothetical protein